MMKYLFITYNTKLKSRQWHFTHRWAYKTTGLPSGWWMGGQEWLPHSQQNRFSLCAPAITFSLRWKHNVKLRRFQRAHKHATLPETRKIRVGLQLPPRKPAFPCMTVARGISGWQSSTGICSFQRTSAVNYHYHYVSSDERTEKGPAH
jgi:hypothetical protein